jgi:hypothetical protein
MILSIHLPPSAEMAPEWKAEAQMLLLSEYRLLPNTGSDAHEDRQEIVKESPIEMSKDFMKGFEDSRSRHSKL